MGDVDAYLASLPAGVERSELQRLHRLINAHVPAVGQATSYSMPCYTYRGVPVAAVIPRRKHIAWYPFSGAVLPKSPTSCPGIRTAPAHCDSPRRLHSRTGLSNVFSTSACGLIDERLGDSP